MLKTRELWNQQNRHDGDRLRLFTAVAEVVTASTVLYPGSYVDVAPSFVFPSVTYVDMDRRAERFFADGAEVATIVAENGGTGAFEFIAADYQTQLPLSDGSFDLLVSLYAGFISDACTRYVRVGGHLLANPSHGDAALAALDSRYDLVGVVESRESSYRVVADQLDRFMVPAREPAPTRAELVESGKGIRYTRRAFAYLFERIA